MKRLGAALHITGIAIALFSYFILFGVVEPIIGMEGIVGKENVVREGLGFVYTNPIAVFLWTAAIALVGLLTNGMGAWLDSHPQKG
jgi:hypothetical protein